VAREGRIASMPPARFRFASVHALCCDPRASSSTRALHAVCSLAGRAHSWGKGMQVCLPSTLPPTIGKASYGCRWTSAMPCAPQNNYTPFFVSSRPRDWSTQSWKAGRPIEQKLDCNITARIGTTKTSRGERRLLRESPLQFERSQHARAANPEYTLPRRVYGTANR
jgi:hypothetical protein